MKSGNGHSFEKLGMRNSPRTDIFGLQIGSFQVARFPFPDRVRGCLRCLQLTQCYCAFFLCVIFLMITAFKHNYFRLSPSRTLRVIFLFLLDNGVMKTPKRRFLSLIFACLCITKSLLKRKSARLLSENVMKAALRENIPSWVISEDCH